jgi:cytochrome c-type biogenesis protein CcsB
MKLSSLSLVIVLGSFLLSSPAIHAQDKSSATPPPPVAETIAPHVGWSFHDLELTPTQSGGRVKPLDSYAREMVLYQTGSRSFEGWSPIDLLFSWLAHPQYWEDHPMIQVGREDVKRQLGLDEKKLRFTPRELFSNFALAQYAYGLNSQRQGMEMQTNPTQNHNNPREQELKRVLDRAGAFREVVSGNAFILIPGVDHPGAEWKSIASRPLDSTSPKDLKPDPEADTIRADFITVLRAYLNNDQTAFERASRVLRAAVEGEIPQFSESDRHKIQAEAFFNHAHPFLWAWILYLCSALIWIITMSRETETRKSKLRRLALAVLGAAVFFHVSGFGLRCFVAGRPPVTNMYESIIWVSFGVVVFASILYVIHRNPITLAVASVLAMLGLIAGDAAPAMLDSSIQPLVPVLRSNYWLTIHVLTITLGYAAFALTLGIADVTLFKFTRPLTAAMRSKIAGLNQLSYRAMQFGVVLLAAGTILGGIWADYSWGRFWGWDPKEVWALIALLSYVVILHARYTGWIGQFGYAVWTVCSFLSVLMAWYGVNFVLGVGLHSYGFSAGGRGAVAGFVIAQLVYVLAIAALRWRYEGAAAAEA